MTPYHSPRSFAHLGTVNRTTGTTMSKDESSWAEEWLIIAHFHSWAWTWFVLMGWCNDNQTLAVATGFELLCTVELRTSCWAALQIICLEADDFEGQKNIRETWPSFCPPMDVLSLPSSAVHVRLHCDTTISARYLIGPLCFLPKNDNNAFMLGIL